MVETIIGSIDVDHIMLCFTENRLIVSKTGGKGKALGVALAFGAIGSGLAARSEKKKREELKKLTPESVLKADKNNFAIPHSNIVRMEMKKKRFSAFVRVIADQQFGKDMKRKKDNRTQQDVYVFEKNLENKKEYENYLNLARSVLSDKVVELK
jgi:hypothetical protein